MNFDALKKSKKQPASNGRLARGFKFTGIGLLLVVTLGKCHLSNLASGRQQEISFGIKNQVLRNVKSQAEFAPLGLASAGHSAAPGEADVDLEALLKDLFSP